VAVDSSEPALPDLDEGEAASIRLALISGPQTLLLIDERAGRAVAAAFGIKVAGTAAVIAMARQRHLIDSAKAVFAELHANDFRIAPAVIQAVLERCGE
jgi:predicted nucleic acid-binding protein